MADKIFLLCYNLERKLPNIPNAGTTPDWEPGFGYRTLYVFKIIDSLNIDF